MDIFSRNVLSQNPPTILCILHDSIMLNSYLNEPTDSLRIELSQYNIIDEGPIDLRTNNVINSQEKK